MKYKPGQVRLMAPTAKPQIWDAMATLYIKTPCNFEAILVVYKKITGDCRAFSLLINPNFTKIFQL